MAKNPKTTTKKKKGPVKREYNEIRLKAKAANERMRQLEKKGYDTGAYKAVQAKLKMIGRPQTKAGKYRFSESARYTYNEMEQLNKILDQFLGSKTSTLSGTKEYYQKVYDTANKNLHLDQYGISKQDYLNFWENMPANQKDRLYGSSEIITMFRAYYLKNKQLKAADRMTPEEIAAAIENNNNKTLKDAQKRLGLDYKDVKKIRTADKEEELRKDAEELFRGK